MKRIGYAALTAVLFVLGLAAPAFAQYAPPAPEVGGTQGGTTQGGTAFTGSDVSMGVVLLVALVVVGAVALLVSRRRATVQR